MFVYTTNEHEVKNYLSEQDPNSQSQAELITSFSELCDKADPQNDPRNHSNEHEKFFRVI